MRDETEAMASYPGMKPMLDFTSFPSRTESVRPRRRRRKIVTPKNPQVKSVCLSQEESVPHKWVSMTGVEVWTILASQT